MSKLSPLEQLGLRVLALHDMIYQQTGGWIGHRVPGAPPSLLLHTVGAKTGQPRTTSLTYARDGDAYLIVASNAGADRYPGWYHNLRKHPDCEINIGPKRFALTARRITPDDSDYQRLWQLVNKNNANRYKGYQSKTSRPMMIFVLTPS
jgi:F420H(2)-dependent quinone reductase